MIRSSPITAIDLGTDKCVTLIATLTEDTHELQVLGVSAIPSRGMKKSQIVNLEQAMETMNESIDAAERMAGCEIRSAYVSISGTQIASQNSKGVVAVAAPTQDITHEDVERVLEAARAVSLPSAREILHVVPRDFAVDSQTGIKDPIGMTGIRLESEAHIITVQSTALRNMNKIMQDLGIQPEKFIFAGLASAEVVLTETEKELGVVLVDIGAGSTSICAYVEGSLTYSSVLPIGARHITSDVALGCRMSLDAAEKVKVHLSSQDIFGSMKPLPGESKDDVKKRLRQEDQLDLSKLGLDEPHDALSKRTIVEGIIVPRVKEMFTMISKDLHHQHILPLIPAGLVLSGGGAETVGIIEVAKRTLNMPARVGKPVELKGVIDDIQKPSFATSIGLLALAARDRRMTTIKHRMSLHLPFTTMKVGEGVSRFLNMIKSFLP